MPVDLSSLPTWAVVLVAAAVAAVVSQPRVMIAVERLRKSRTTVKIVREQRRMATLVLKSGTELQHSVGDGPELVIRTTVPDSNDGDAQGRSATASDKAGVPDEEPGPDTPGDSPLEDEALPVFRGVHLDVAPDQRATTPRPAASGEPSDELIGDARAAGTPPPAELRTGTHRVETRFDRLSGSWAASFLKTRFVRCTTPLLARTTDSRKSSRRFLECLEEDDVGASPLTRDEVSSRLASLLGQRAWGTSLGTGSFLTIEFGEARLTTDVRRTCDALANQNGSMAPGMCGCTAVPGESMGVLEWCRLR